MRRSLRFVVGASVGGAILAGYLYTVGAETVVSRAAAVAPWALAVVSLLVVLEGVTDSIGVWASVAPLGDGISGVESVQFALAGDFFDTLSPAGPVSSEPIMARFFSVATGSGYSDALGVRSTAKYVKSTTQILFSGLLGLFILADSPDATPLLLTLGLSLGGLALFAGILLRSRAYLSKGLVAVLAPLIRRVSSVYRDQPHDRDVVAAAVGRYWQRIVDFRETPELLVLITVGGLLEQLLTAATIWVAITGLGVDSVFLPILVIVPLPQIASVVPIPGSVGAYDVLLGGALVVVTGIPSVVATAAVLLFRTVSLPFGVLVGGISAAYLRGWRPGAG